MDTSLDLPTHDSFTYLSLADNKIGDRGAKALAKSLMTNNVLQTLDLEV